MGKICLIIILVFTGQLAFSQSVEASLIKYKGLDFSATKTEIISRLGKPESIYYPNYECGFLTPLPDEENYFTLDYGRVKFTGNETEGLVLELVDFEKDSLSVLKYGLNELSYKTSFIELVEIFGSDLSDNLLDKNNGSVVIYFQNSDDGIRLEVKNGKLIKFEYWSPCQLRRAESIFKSCPITKKTSDLCGNLFLENYGASGVFRKTCVFGFRKS